MAGGAVGGEAARRALEQAALDAAARVEGGGAPSATAQRGRRALGAERRLRVLHLFAGPARDDSLAAEFEARGWETVEVDVLQGQDLLRGKYYRTLLQRARDAEFDLVIIGSPCGTYSWARFRDGGTARPLRRRSAGGRVGGLSAKERWALQEADELVERAAKIAEAVATAGGEFVWENPADRGDPALAGLGLYNEPDHFPLWLEPVMVRLQQRFAALQLHFPQCFFGSPFQKWTTLLASPGAAALLAPGLARAVCLHARHEQRARGYDQYGEPNAPRAAAYPPGMHAFLANTLAEGLSARGGGVACAPVAGGVRGGGTVAAASKQQDFHKWLECWEEAPALRRAMAQSSGEAGRFSMAVLLPEHRSVVRRLMMESAEEVSTRAGPRADWRLRRGPVEGAEPVVHKFDAGRHPLAPVDVGHEKRERRRGYSGVWVGRGRGSWLGNPFLMQNDNRSAGDKAATSTRDAVCSAYAALLRGPAEAGAAQRLAGGLAVDPRLDSAEAAAARAQQLAELRARVEGGEKLQLTCTCHPQRCHADALADWLLERTGWVDPGGNDDLQVVDEAWRPAGGARGLFWDANDFYAMGEWQEQAALACDALLSGAGDEAGAAPPMDLHIPAERLRPEARALAPWRTGGAFAAAPVPVAQLAAQAGALPPPCGLEASVFQQLAVGGDEEIASELPWGLEDDASGLDVYLAFHHPSCAQWPGELEAVIEKEGADGEGWLQFLGDTPFVPLRCVPKGVVDQIHKKRVVTDHTYPFGYGISANDGVGIEHLPDIKLSSGVRFAHSVAVAKSAGVGVLMWKRDAVAAYRQVPINPRDLWKCGLVGRRGVLVDTRLSFGARMAPNKFQRLMLIPVREAMRRIAKFDDAHPPSDPRVVRWLAERRAALGDAQARLAAVVQYIDDTLGVSVNDYIDSTGKRRGEHHAAIFDAVMQEVGVVMAEGEKRVDSELEVEALGIAVSAAEDCVYYPEKKRLRLEARIKGILEQATSGWVPRAAVESLVGKEKWVAHVAPSLQPKLASAYAMAHARGAPLNVVPSVAFLADQRAILEALPTLPRRPLLPRSEFPPLDDGESTVLFQDASGSWGIGGFFVDGGDMIYFSEQYPPDIAAALRARRLSIGPAELAAELAAVLLALERRLAAPYFTDFTDNESARVAAMKGTSGSPTMGPLAHALAAATAQAGVALRTFRVTTDENKISDDLSRDGSTRHLLKAAAAAQLRVVRVGVPDRVWQLLREGELAACGPE